MAIVPEVIEPKLLTLVSIVEINTWKLDIPDIIVKKLWQTTDLVVVDVDKPDIWNILKTIQAIGGIGMSVVS